MARTARKGYSEQLPADPQPRIKRHGWRPTRRRSYENSVQAEDKSVDHTNRGTAQESGVTDKMNGRQVLRRYAHSGGGLSCH